jgi:hypothetical protein
MTDCYICHSLIRSDQDFIKLPCCLRKVHDKCQLEISCKKWQKMAKNNKFDGELCTICNRKITTPIEKSFMSMYLTIKLIRKKITDNDIEIAKEILDEDWKNKVYEQFGEILKDKFSILKIRQSKKPILESLSTYIINYTKGILESLEDEGKYLPKNMSGVIQSDNNNITTEILQENDLPEELKEKFKNLPKPNIN